MGKDKELSVSTMTEQEQEEMLNFQEQGKPLVTL